MADIKTQISETRLMGEHSNLLPFQIKTMFDNSLTGLCYIDKDGRLLTMNARFCQVLGFDPETSQGRFVADVFLDHIEPLYHAVTQVLQGSPTLAYKLKYKNQTLIVNFLRDESIVEDNAGKEDGFPDSGSKKIQNRGISVALIDITQFQLTLRRLSLADERTNFALESAGQWIWDMDIKADRVWRSPQYRTVLGLKDEIPEGAAISWDIVHPDDKALTIQIFQDVLTGRKEIFEAIYRVIKEDGKSVWIMSRGKIVEWSTTGEPLRLLATSVDISGQKNIETQLSSNIKQRVELERRLLDVNRKLRKQSEYDHLTNLPNRRKFSQHLRLEFMRAVERKQPLSILMIDIDYFKAFNDLYGHLAGDQCLTAIGGVLSQLISQPDNVAARFGGEEFVVILVNTPQQQAASIAQTIVDCISGLKVPHADSPCAVVTASIGVGTLNEDNCSHIPDPYALLNLADKALYRTKGTGRNGVNVWDIKGE